jgi:hypothetical protein
MDWRKKLKEFIENAETPDYNWKRAVDKICVEVCSNFIISDYISDEELKKFAKEVKNMTAEEIYVWFGKEE